MVHSPQVYFSLASDPAEQADDSVVQVSPAARGRHREYC